jgi:uncharacterized membrane protein
MTINTKEQAWRIFLGATFFLIGIWGLVLAVKGRGGDTAIYAQAAERFLEGSALYRASDGNMPFKYSPPAAVLFLPLGLLPRPLPAILVNLLSAGAVVQSFRIVRTWIGQADDCLEGPASGGPLLYAAIASVLALLAPLYFVLFYGQVDAIILGLLTQATFDIGQAKSARAGILFALAVLLKPPAVLFGLLLLPRARRGAFLYASVVVFALAAIVALRYTVPGTVSLFVAWRQLLSGTTAPWIIGHNAQGLPSLILGLTQDWTGTVPKQGSMLWVQALSTGCFLALLSVRKLAFPCEASVLMLGTALLSPLAWRANFVLLLPALLLVLSHHAVRFRGPWTLAAAFFLIGLFIRRDLLGPELEADLLRLRPYAFLSLLLLRYLTVPKISHEAELGQDVQFTAAGSANLQLGTQG